jgi:hypothetical protein
VIASHELARLGQAGAGQDLADAATQAFLHSLAGGCQVAAGVALAGALVAALLLPARPRRQDEAAAPGQYKLAATAAAVGRNVKGQE